MRNSEYETIKYKQNFASYMNREQIYQSTVQQHKKDEDSCGRDTQQRRHDPATGIKSWKVALQYLALSSRHIKERHDPAGGPNSPPRIKNKCAAITSSNRTLTADMDHKKCGGKTPQAEATPRQTIKKATTKARFKHKTILKCTCSRHTTAEA
jgi:hypothetical protein